MSRRKMENLKSMLCDELDKISDKGNISAGDLEAAHKLTDTIKNIYKIGMLEDVDSGEYSERGYYYDDGMSYTRHDSRGRYSHDEGRSYGGDRGRSYDRGYSSHSMDQYITDMLAEAKDDRQREAIRRLKSELDR